MVSPKENDQRHQAGLQQPHHQGPPTDAAQVRLGARHRHDQPQGHGGEREAQRHEFADGDLCDR
jgi:hypothetical protein